VERALLDPDNLALLASHLTCAAFELPFDQDESFGSFSDVRALLDVLADEDILHRSNGRYMWIGEGYPAAGLSLRAGTPDNIVIQARGGRSSDERTAPYIIGQMDRPSAPTLIHEGAIYLHSGETYLVDSLDWDEGIAHVQAVEVDYYTRATSTTDVQVIENYATSLPGELGERAGLHKDLVHGYGEVSVTTRATGYRKIKRYTHETLAWAPIELPEQALHTTGYWLTLSEALTEQLQESGILPQDVDYGPDWPEQRNAARSRDGYRCRQCGTPERDDRQHDVHHLVPFRSFGYVPGSNELYKLANRLENLITLCTACHRHVERARGARGALSGLAYVLRNLAPLHLMCDPGDLGAAVGSQSGLPSVTLYDRVPGGAGLSVRLYDLCDELLTAALDVVSNCPCGDGCPSCVGPAGDVGAGTKALTRQLLESIVLQVGD
jgi:DEAD/DEAH box helicase domain-containing protein